MATATREGRPATRDEGLAPLVTAAREGDARAFEALAERFREPLTAYATALLHDRGHAEDAVQEAVLHAWRRLPSLRDPAHFRPWLYAILENAALSGWRLRHRRPQCRLRGDEAVAEGAAPVLPAEPPPERPEVAALRSALAALPEPYRAVLLMHYVEGLSNREVALATGLSFNNAKVRLYRARIALRRELAARGVRGLPRRPARREP